MADIRNLLNPIAAQGAQLRETQFLAPYMRGGRVRTSVANMNYTFTPQPRNAGARNFDLQSLVGVLEARDNWDF